MDEVSFEGLEVGELAMTAPEEAIVVILDVFDELSGDRGFADAGQSREGDYTAVLFEEPLFEEG